MISKEEEGGEETRKLKQSDRKKKIRWCEDLREEEDRCCVNVPHRNAVNELNRSCRNETFPILLLEYLAVVLTRSARLPTTTAPSPLPP